MTFCHLNVHTDRSQFVGMIKPAELVDWCKRTGLAAAAITDHDNMCAAVLLYKECQKHRLKPIYGMEVSLCEDKTQRKRGTKNLVLIAKNLVGFKNLITLATVGSMYFYYRPRIDWSDLQKYGEGLIAITACLNGFTAGKFFLEGHSGLTDAMDQLRAVFGDDVYLEVEPTLKEAQRIYNDACVALAQRENAKLVATGDPHYLNAEDREFHEHFMRIKVIGSKEGEWRYPFDGPYHLRTRDEMVEQFGELHGYDVTALPEYKAAFDNVDRIIESVDAFDIKEGVKIPTYFV